jgi:two-component system chemotaxis response regulator CheB
MVEASTSGIRRDGIKIIGIAASAGGLQAVSKLVAQFPSKFEAAILLVQHLDPHHRSHMAEILSKRCSLRVKEAQEGDLIRAGSLYVAPPNKHMLASQDGSISLTQSELVHFVRPSADLLLESIAATYKKDAIAVVLTGTGSDGAMGVQAIKKMNGTVFVQDPKSSDFSGMPEAAIQTGEVDFVLPLDEIANALLLLVGKKE